MMLLINWYLYQIGIGNTHLRRYVTSLCTVVRVRMSSWLSILAGGRRMPLHVLSALSDPVLIYPCTS